MSERAIIDRRDRHPCDWTVMRGRRCIGCVLLQRNGQFMAFVNSVRHYCAPVGNVAAGVRWIAMRAPR